MYIFGIKIHYDQTILDYIVNNYEKKKTIKDYLMMKHLQKL